MDNNKPSEKEIYNALINKVSEQQDVIEKLKIELKNYLESPAAQIKYTSLHDTIGLMCSEEYKDRFKAEYLQLKFRTDKLRTYLSKIEAVKDSVRSIEEPKHDCNTYILREQLELMNQYLYILQKRAYIEGVDIYE